MSADVPTDRVTPQELHAMVDEMTLLADELDELLRRRRLRAGRAPEPVLTIEERRERIAMLRVENDAMEVEQIAYHTPH